MTDPQGINIPDVIRKSTSDVPLAELAKKGFKRVKVLNKDTINRLIAEAVNEVISERIRVSTEGERQQIEQAARAKFDELVQEQRRQAEELEERDRAMSTLQSHAQASIEELNHARQRCQELEAALNARNDELATNREVCAQLQNQDTDGRQKLAALEMKLAGLEMENRRLAGEIDTSNAELQSRSSELEASLVELESNRTALAASEAELAELKEAAPAESMKELQESLERLHKKIEHGGTAPSTGGVGRSPSRKDSDVAVQAMLSNVSDSPLESNISSVDVKKTKAAGVSSTLEKLRNMKKGGS